MARRAGRPYRAGMDRQQVSDWRQLVLVQRELVAEYLRSVGEGATRDDLAALRNLLARVACEVETARRALPRGGRES